MGGNPLNWYNLEDIPDDIQGTPLATHELVRLLGNESLGIFVEEVGDGIDLFWGARQLLQHPPLFPLSPFGRISSKEEPWTMDDLGDPVQEWIPELLLVSEDARYFSILLELANAVGTLGSFQVILILLAEFRQDFVHGLGSHEWEPGVGTIVGELLGESAKEESTKHGTESRVLWRPDAIGETPSSKVVCGEICGKETIPTNESDGIRKDGTRDGVTGAETGTLDYWFGVFSLETSVQLKIVNRSIELLGGGGNLFVWVPFQECLVWSQAEVLQKRENVETKTR